MGNNTFEYKRYMRDGTVENRTGTTDQAQRIRKGKTEKDGRKRHGK